VRALRDFDEFVKSGTIRWRRPDTARARSLVSEAEHRCTFLRELVQKIPISEENANYFVEGAYDVLISLIRAKLLVDGLSSSGEGAHEAEVAYMRKLGLSEVDTRFMNDLRYFRNSIKYYGKQFDQEYAQKVLDFMERLYPKLIEIMKEHL
jgi:hypothetical protein